MNLSHEEFKKKYIESINAHKLVLVNPEGYLPPGVKGAPENVKPLIIAPLNTDIRYNNKTNLQKSKESFIIRLPDIWNWREDFAIDGTIKNMKEKKKLIEKPRNQMFCGSCWAISTVSTISDKFVARGKVDYSPNLSATYILSSDSISQLKCDGGNILKLHKSLEMSGIATSRCVDYSWCKDNPYCNAEKEENNGGKEFKNPEELTMYLNSIIPEKGCYFPENKDLYLIKDVTIYNNHNSDDEIENFMCEARLHIFDHGPICAGFVVYMNFLSGNFSLTNNIYIETVDYINSDSTNTVFYNDFTPVGGHAISVIGWGEEEVKCFGKVKYWYCRNTWGDKWGNDSGYFKFAAYPINKESRMDVSFDDMGGFIFCKPDRIIEDKIYDDIDEDKLKGYSIKKNEKYYRLEYGEKNVLNSELLSKNMKVKTHTRKNIIFVLIVIIIFSIIFLLFHLYK